MLKVDKIFPCSRKPNLVLRIATSRLRFILLLGSVFATVTCERTSSESVFEIGKDQIKRTFTGNIPVSHCSWSKVPATVDFRVDLLKTEVSIILNPTGSNMITWILLTNLSPGIKTDEN